MARKKVLFFAEAVTLAHVGRALTLAAALDPAQYDIHFACADGYDFCFKDTTFTRWRVTSIPSAQFLKALAKGKPVYSKATLNSYVEEDLRLLDQVRPDVVIGDFRISLSISARLAKIPYVSLTNAYWSPFVRQRYSVPNIPLTTVLPIRIANALFRMARPVAFAAHSNPLNSLRRKYGLPSLGADLRKVYTDADFTIYADIPELFPATRDMPPSHSFLGPVMWAPPIALPAWWNQLPPDRPIVYVTLGSSGQGRLLPLVLQALAHLPITVLAATAGNIKIDQVPENAFIAEFLPGDQAAARSRLVICNGGSPTSHQALAAGVPVLGIASNLDQFLNMHGVVTAGAGALLRADRFKPAELQRVAKELLANQSTRQAARSIAESFAKYDHASRFQALLTGILG